MNYKSIHALLLIPGNQINTVDNITGTKSYHTFIDLEDGVPSHDKDNARDQTINFFKNKQLNKNFMCGIRINSLRSATGLRDILSIIDSKIQPDFIICPKTEFATEINILDELFQFKISLIALIESELGISNSKEIALASTNLKAIACGGGDLAHDIGIIANWESMFSARCAIISSATIAKIATIDMPFSGISDDEDGITNEMIRVNGLGFTGKFALNLHQAQTIEAIFNKKATQAEITEALAVVSAFEKSNGNICTVNGKIIDEHAFKIAKEILSKNKSL